MRIPRLPFRAARVVACGLAAVLLSISPTTTAAQTTTAAPDGWGYGFQVQLWHYDPVARQNVIGDVTQAGFNWMTQQIDWGEVELAPAEYDFSQLDAIVNDGNAAGLKILMKFFHAPAFYRSDTSGLMPSDPATFGAFMNAVAARYAGKVRAYELWNEENLDRETGPGNVDPANYLPLLKAGYTGVKSADPGALVLLGAPSPTTTNIPGSIMDDTSYLQGLYAINGGEVAQYFDVLSAHPSGFSNPPDCTPTTPECSLSGAWNEDDSFYAFNRVSQYHDILVQNNDAGKKIWFTEFGYCSNSTPPAGYEYCTSIDASTQARFLVQAFQMARALDYVAGMMQWNLNFQLAVPQTDEKWGFGVIRDDWSPRPAYSALAEMPKI